MDLLIQNAPDVLIEKLRSRAERHKRSIEREVLAIIEAAIEQPERLSPAAILAQVRQLGLCSPSEAAELVRSDRDGRHRH